jgi:lipopolysaccharide transport system ATP-binding protein
LVKPDTGRITIRGSIRGLIALRAGFNPVLTGRENIYIKSSIIGLDKCETERLIPVITNFSELLSFIDTSVQNYSFGMQARLGSP